MVLKRPPEAGDILQGTLDMLILRTLVWARRMATPSRRPSSTPRRTRSKSSRARFIRRFIALRTAGWLLGMGREREQPQGKVLPAHHAKAAKNSTPRPDAGGRMTRAIGLILGESIE